jgi:hypothetical protein
MLASLAFTLTFLLNSYAAAAMPQPTPAPLQNGTEKLTVSGLRKRQIVTEMLTCGFYNGDPALSRTADPDFNCRVDAANKLWGFCPTTVIAASDCGFARRCVDSHACKTGCGRTNIRPSQPLHGV